MDINVSIDIIQYTLWFFWIIILLCLLGFVFIVIFWDALFPEYDQTPDILYNGEDNESINGKL